MLSQNNKLLLHMHNTICGGEWNYDKKDYDSKVYVDFLDYEPGSYRTNPESCIPHIRVLFSFMFATPNIRSNRWYQKEYEFALNYNQHGRSKDPPADWDERYNEISTHTFPPTAKTRQLALEYQLFLGIADTDHPLPEGIRDNLAEAKSIAMIKLSKPNGCVPRTPWCCNMRRLQSEKDFQTMGGIFYTTSLSAYLGSQYQVIRNPDINLEPDVFVNAYGREYDPGIQKTGIPFPYENTRDPLPQHEPCGGMFRNFLDFNPFAP